METARQEQYEASEHIAGVVGKIVELCHVKKIYLYNQRVGLQGGTTSFKLCVVADNDDNQALEHLIYMEIDCDVPFDVVAYDPQEWEQMSASPDTFASKIARTGLLVYG